MPYKDPAVARQKSCERYLAKREEILAKAKKYVADHPEETKARHRDWFQRNKEKMRRYYASYRGENRASCREKQQAYKDRLRKRVFDHYGRRCQCCGEDRVEFLAMDHVNGGGNKHRREARLTNSADLFLWIIRNGFPPDFQTLCHNCNMAKAFYGRCPHEAEPEYGIGVAC